MPRRQFLGASAWGAVLGAAASSLPVWSSATARLLLPFASEKVMLQTLTHAAFAANLGSAFRLEVAPGQFIALTLTEARSLTDRFPGKGKGKTEGEQRPEPFSLLFHASDALELAQRIYTVHHERMGHFDLFLVPLGRDAAGLRCEAIFN